MVIREARHGEGAVRRDLKGRIARIPALEGLIRGLRADDIQCGDGCTDIILFAVDGQVGPAECLPLRRRQIAVIVVDDLCRCFAAVVELQRELLGGRGDHDALPLAEGRHDLGVDLGTHVKVGLIGGCADRVADDTRLGLGVGYDVVVVAEFIHQVMLDDIIGIAGDELALEHDILCRHRESTAGGDGADLVGRPAGEDVACHRGIGRRFGILVVLVCDTGQRGRVLRERALVLVGDGVLDQIIIELQRELRGSCDRAAGNAVRVRGVFGVAVKVSDVRGDGLTGGRGVGVAGRRILDIAAVRLLEVILNRIVGINTERADQHNIGGGHHEGPARGRHAGGRLDCPAGEGVAIGRRIGGDLYVRLIYRSRSGRQRRAVCGERAFVFVGDLVGRQVVVDLQHQRAVGGDGAGELAARVRGVLDVAGEGLHDRISGLAGDAVGVVLSRSLILFVGGRVDAVLQVVLNSVGNTADPLEVAVEGDVGGGHDETRHILGDNDVRVAVPADEVVMLNRGIGGHLHGCAVEVGLGVRGGQLVLRLDWRAALVGVGDGVRISIVVQLEDERVCGVTRDDAEKDFAGCAGCKRQAGIVLDQIGMRGEHIDRLTGHTAVVRDLLVERISAAVRVLPVVLDVEPRIRVRDEGADQLHVVCGHREGGAVDDRGSGRLDLPAGEGIAGALKRIFHRDGGVVVFGGVVAGRNNDAGVGAFNFVGDGVRNQLVVEIDHQLRALRDDLGVRRSNVAIVLVAGDICEPIACNGHIRDDIARRASQGDGLVGRGEINAGNASGSARILQIVVDDVGDVGRIDEIAVQRDVLLVLGDRHGELCGVGGDCTADLGVPADEVVVGQRKIARDGDFLAVTVAFAVGRNSRSTGRCRAVIRVLDLVGHSVVVQAQDKRAVGSDHTALERAADRFVEHKAVVGQDGDIYALAGRAGAVMTLVQGVVVVVDVLPVVFNAVLGVGVGMEVANQHNIAGRHREAAGGLVDDRRSGRGDRPAGEGVAGGGRIGLDLYGGVVGYILAAVVGQRRCICGDKAVVAVGDVILVDGVIELQDKRGVLRDDALRHAACDRCIVGVTRDAALVGGGVNRRAGRAVRGVGDIRRSRIGAVGVLEIVLDSELDVSLGRELAVERHAADGHHEVYGAVGDGAVLRMPAGEGVIEHSILRGVRLDGNGCTVHILDRVCGRVGRAGRYAAVIEVGDLIFVSDVVLVHRELTVSGDLTGRNGSGNRGVQRKALVGSGRGRYILVSRADAGHGLLLREGAVEILRVMDRLVGDSAVCGEVTDQLNIVIGHGEAGVAGRNGGIGRRPAGEGVAGNVEIGRDGDVSAVGHAGLCARCGRTGVVAGDRIGDLVLLCREGAGEDDVLLRHGEDAAGDGDIARRPAVEAVAREVRDGGALRDRCAGETVIPGVDDGLVGGGIDVLIGYGVCRNIRGLNHRNALTAAVEQVGGAVVGGNIAVCDRAGVGVDHGIVGGRVDRDDQLSAVVSGVGAAGTRIFGDIVLVIVEAVYLDRLSADGVRQTGRSRGRRPAPCAVGIFYAVGRLEGDAVSALRERKVGRHGVDDLSRRTEGDGGGLDLLRDRLEDGRQRRILRGGLVVAAGGIAVVAGGVHVRCVGVVARYIVQELVDVLRCVRCIGALRQTDRIHLCTGELEVVCDRNRRVRDAAVKAAAVVRLAVGEDDHGLVAGCRVGVGRVEYRSCHVQAEVDRRCAAGIKRVHRRRQGGGAGLVDGRQVGNQLGIVVVGIAAGALVVAHGQQIRAIIIGIVCKLHQRDAMQLGAALFQNLAVFLVRGLDEGFDRRLQRVDGVDGIVLARLADVKLHDRIFIMLAGDIARVGIQPRIDINSSIVCAVIAVVIASAAVRAHQGDFTVIGRSRRADVDVILAGGAASVEIAVIKPSGIPVYTAVYGRICPGVGGDGFVHRARHIQHEDNVGRDSRDRLSDLARGVGLDGDIDGTVGLTVLQMRRYALAQDDAVTLVCILHHVGNRLCARRAGCRRHNIGRDDRHQHQQR